MQIRREEDRKMDSDWSGNSLREILLADKSELYSKIGSVGVLIAIFSSPLPLVRIA